jgi:hypothetical protein
MKEVNVRIKNKGSVTLSLVLEVSYQPIPEKTLEGLQLGWLKWLEFFSLMLFYFYEGILLIKG